MLSFKHAAGLRDARRRQWRQRVCRHRAGQRWQPAGRAGDSGHCYECQRTGRSGWRLQYQRHRRCRRLRGLAEGVGTSVVLPNDTTPGTVTQVDYNVWRANFGRSAAASGASMPEVVAQADGRNEDVFVVSALAGSDRLKAELRTRNERPVQFRSARREGLANRTFQDHCAAGLAYVETHSSLVRVRRGRLQRASARRRKRSNLGNCRGSRRGLRRTLGATRQIDSRLH